MAEHIECNKKKKRLIEVIKKKVIFFFFFRFERFKVDEEERRKIEQEEAIYQAEQKRQILEKANQQIYENNDRVRAFQSKILLTDIH